MKICTSCKEDLPLTSFYKGKGKDGLSYTCTTCHLAYFKNRYEQREILDPNTNIKVCSTCKKEKFLNLFQKGIGSDGYAYTCKVCCKAYEEQRKEKRRVKYLESMKDPEIRESRRLKTAKWLVLPGNKEKRNLATGQWREEHPENVRAINRRGGQRRKARMNNLIATLTEEEWQEILIEFNHCCMYCRKSFDNLVQEHKIPVVKGGGYTKDNIVPACTSCNSKKGTKSFEDFVSKN